MGKQKVAACKRGPTPSGQSIRARWAVILTGMIPFLATAQVQNQVIGAGYSASFESPPLPTVFPGQILTLFTSPLGVPDATAAGTPLPTSLSGVSVLVRVLGAQDATGYPTSLPILRIDNLTKPQLPSGEFCSTVPGPVPVLCSYTQITIEIPTEHVCALTPSDIKYLITCTNTSFHNDPPMLVLNVKANGVTGPDLPMQVGVGIPHFLNSCDSVFGPQPSSTCHPPVTHPDGSVVSDNSPARVGETITIYSLVESNAPTGYPPTSSAGGPNRITIAFNYPLSGQMPNAGLTGTSATTQTAVGADWFGTVPGYVGLGQINVTVPPRPNDDYQCGGSTYPNQPGNAEVTFPGHPENTIYLCIHP